MRLESYMMVQDLEVAEMKEINAVEKFKSNEEPFFLDGPISKSVAVLDFDEKTGALKPGVPFIKAGSDTEYGGYKLERADDLEQRPVAKQALKTRDFMNVNAFATVLSTKYMFEEEDALGREIEWAFDGPQLLVIPRAGVWPNAYYERDSRSLQLFYYEDPREKGKMVYTSLSRDIIAHEAAHAILDGIAPDLYDAVTPQSLALHEAVADMAALLMATRSRDLVLAVLERTGGRIDRSTAFTAVAEEFGISQSPYGAARPLRNLLNEATLDPSDPEHLVSRYEPHELSTVLSGALYKVLVGMHEREVEHLSRGDEGRRFSVSGKALFVARERLKRIMVRGLDYLPPGDVSFADYGRAIVASDQAYYETRNEDRECLKREFLKRGMVTSAQALEVDPPFEHEMVQKADLEDMATSDWVAYQFANANRELLMIPEGIPFEVRPRLTVNKKYYHSDGDRYEKELLFKVSWDLEEDNDLGDRFDGRRRITVGTTMAIDWRTKRVNAVLTSDHTGEDITETDEEEYEGQVQDRDLLLRMMADSGLLLPEGTVRGTEAMFHASAEAFSTAEVMHVKGAGRMLHLKEG